MRKLMIAILMVFCISLGGCGEKESKEWTYELLEEEFGGIIEAEYEEMKDCIKLLSKEEYGVCGYVREYGSYEFMGHTLAHIEIADGETESQYENRLHVTCEQSDLQNLTNGDYIYASGTFLAKVEYSKNDYQYQISADGKIFKNQNEDREYISVRDFYMLIDKIHDDTFFKVKGLIIKDDDRYYLYQSENSYKENKYNRIEIEFSETQSNLNGKTVVIMGKPEVGSMFEGLKECSIVEE